MSSLMLHMFSLPQDVLDEQSLRKRVLQLEDVRNDRQPVKEPGFPPKHIDVPTEEQNFSLSISRQFYINSARYWIGWTRIEFYNLFWNTPPSIDKHNETIWLFPGPQIPGALQYPLSDPFFAQQRFCGPQTSLLSRLEKLPNWVTPTEELQTLCANGQLFCVDYSILQGLALKPGAHLPSVVGVFSCTEGSNFGVVALMVDGKVIGPQTPGLWTFAKACFQVNDAAYFLVINRLCGAFLFLEPVVLHFYRNISVKHPLYPLLHPLFYGHATACDWVRQFFLEEGGLLNQLLPLSTQGIRDLVKIAYEHWSFEGTNFVNKLSARKILRCEGYAYAEDGTDLFSITQMLVAAYINKIYPQDKDVLEDRELQEWLLQTASPEEGNVRSFPERVTTKAILIQLLAHVFYIFLFDRYVIHQGAYDHMCFMPSFPLDIAKYDDHSPPLTSEEVFHLLSSEKRTLSQMHAMYVFFNEILPEPRWNIKEIPTELADFLTAAEKQFQLRKMQLRDRLKQRLSPYRHFILKQGSFVHHENL